MFTFIETKLFTRLFDEIFSDDALSELQEFLRKNPEVGDIVPGSGGVRKMRWGTPGVESEGAYGSSTT